MSEIFVSSEHENFANAAARTAAAGSLSERRKRELSDRGGRSHDVTNEAGQKARAGALGEVRKTELSARGGRWHEISNVARPTAAAGTSSRASRSHNAPAQAVKFRAER